MMKKRILALALVACLFIAQVPTALGIATVADLAKPVVVQVIAILDDWDYDTDITSEEVKAGSGIYIDARGYVVACYDLLSDADRFAIETAAGDRISCEMVGYDDGTNIAVLKFDEGDIGAQPLVRANSDDVMVGDAVISVGNPDQLPGSVLRGYVSGLKRRNVAGVQFMRPVELIQIDRSMKDSGGVLINEQGELLGILSGAGTENKAPATNSEPAGAEGQPMIVPNKDMTGIYDDWGFALPISKAGAVIDQLIENGKYVRPRMGVTVSDMEGPEEPIKDHPPAGAMVAELDPNGAAAQAGVMMYDVITHFDDVRILNMADLLNEVDRREVGDKVQITVYRCIDPISLGMLDNPESLNFTVDLRILD